MKMLARLRAFCLSAVLALATLLPVPAVAQVQSYQLLAAVGVSGPIVYPTAGSYTVSLSGTFGGATITLNLVQGIGGQTTALGTWTSAPTTLPCVVIPAGASIQMVVTGGSPSGLYSTAGGNGSSSCPSSGSGGGVNATIVAPVGQKTMSASLPVVLASDQSALPVSSGVAQGSTTSGQTVSPIGCRTLASAPTDTTAQTNIPRCPLNGALSIDQTSVNGTAIGQGNGASGDGDPRVNIANDNSAIPNWGQGATGSAVPTGAQYQGLNIGGNLTAPISCQNYVIYDASTNGSTQLVALSAGKVIYICGYTIFAAGTVNVELDYGTGPGCATGNNKIIPAFQLTAQNGIVDRSLYYQGLNAIASNELCLKTSIGVAVQAIVYYTQF